MERVSRSGAIALLCGQGQLHLLLRSGVLAQKGDFFWMRLTKVPTPPHEIKSPGKLLQNANTRTSCRDSFLIGLSIDTFEILTR